MKKIFIIDSTSLNLYISELCIFLKLVITLSIFYVPSIHNPVLSLLTIEVGAVTIFASK